MTTYLLYGGKTSTSHHGVSNFFAQFTKLVNKDSVTILLCYFARERSTWQALIERDSNLIKRNTNKEIVILAAENPEDLFNKLEKSDVIYVAGGDAEPIEALYEQLVNLKSKLSGKVFAGSSMGAFIVAESYVLSMSDQAENEVHKGLGLLPIQVLCHWDKEGKQEKKLKILQDYSSLLIIALNEYEFVTIYGT